MKICLEALKNSQIAFNTLPNTKQNSMSYFFAKSGRKLTPRPYITMQQKPQWRSIIERSVC